MQPYHIVTRSGSRIQNATLKTICTRQASLVSAINGGVRKAARALRSAESRRIKEGNLSAWERDDPEKAQAAQEAFRNSRRQQIEQRQRLAFLRDDTTTGEDRFTMNTTSRRASILAKGILVDAPTAVPYTHAAAEFLYGTSAVLSALKAERRQFYHLYIWCGEDGEIQDNDDDTRKIVQLANNLKIPIKRVAGAWERILTKMAHGRPHNGYILEASLLPKVTINTLNPVEKTGPLTYEPLDVRQQGSKSTELPRTTMKRFPFLLWLDKVKDTGNMGAIIRSAYYFGAEGIITPNHGTAPINGVIVKSSAGAAEYLPVLTIDHELEFLNACKKNGWKFFAARADESNSTNSTKGIQSKTIPLNPTTVLKDYPAILMVGSEDEGIRLHLQQRADSIVSIKPVRNDGVLDSLNVSVAAALLTQRFLGTD